MYKYFFVFNYLIIILVGLFFYDKLKQSLPLKLFLGFLVYSLVTEILGTYLGYFVKINNAVVYNSWNIINYLFFSFFYWTRVNNTFKRKFIIGFAILFITLELVNIFFFQNILTTVYRFNSVIGKFLIAILIILYFTELLKSDAILNVKESMFFWISLGVFLYVIGFIPVFIIAELIEYGGIFKDITLSLNIAMSLCFITGFIVSKKEFNN